MSFIYYQQAGNLQKLYRTRKEKIKENRQKTEEAWSLAKEEAAKSKAAKEVIQALTSRVFVSFSELL